MRGFVGSRGERFDVAVPERAVWKQIERDYFVPASLTFTWRDELWPVTVHVEIQDGAPQCVGLTSVPDGRPITVRGLRALNLPRFMREVLAMVAYTRGELPESIAALPSYIRAADGKAEVGPALKDVVTGPVAFPARLGEGGAQEVAQAVGDVAHRGLKRRGPGARRPLTDAFLAEVLHVYEAAPARKRYEALEAWLINSPIATEPWKKDEYVPRSTMAGYLKRARKKRALNFSA